MVRENTKTGNKMPRTVKDSGSSSNRPINIYLKVEELASLIIDCIRERREPTGESEEPATRPMAKVNGREPFNAIRKRRVTRATSKGRVLLNRSPSFVDAMPNRKVKSIDEIKNVPLWVRRSPFATNYVFERYNYKSEGPVTRPMAKGNGREPFNAIDERKILPLWVRRSLFASNYVFERYDYK